MKPTQQQYWQKGAAHSSPHLRPIEIVEYQRHHSLCQCCGEITSPQWSQQIVPGQDLGIKLQGLLGWLGNYGHLPYKKQQELLWELGRIEVGLGTLVASNQRVSAAIKPSVTELEEWMVVSQKMRIACSML